MISLPDELLLFTFSYLEKDNLATASCVCRRWRQIAGDASLYITTLAKTILELPRDCCSFNALESKGILATEISVPDRHYWIQTPGCQIGKVLSEPVNGTFHAYECGNAYFSINHDKGVLVIRIKDGVLTDKFAFESLDCGTIHAIAPLDSRSMLVLGSYILTTYTIMYETGAVIETNPISLSWQKPYAGLSGDCNGIKIVDDLIWVILHSSVYCFDLQSFENKPIEDHLPHKITQLVKKKGDLKLDLLVHFQDDQSKYLCLLRSSDRSYIVSLRTGEVIAMDSKISSFTMNKWGHFAYQSGDQSYIIGLAHPFNRCYKETFGSDLNLNAIVAIENLFFLIFHQSSKDNIHYFLPIQLAPICLTSAY